MDLIYTNAKREDVGVFALPTLDFSFGDEENDFELTIPRRQHCCEEGSLIYAENTEIGGIVDGLRVDTAADTVTYTGRTWHGVLAKKIIEPDASGAAVTGVTVAVSDAALVISGDANACISWVCKRIGVDGLFTLPTEKAGVTVTKYAFPRYCDAYTGLRGMLDAVGLRLSILWQYGELLIASTKRYDYSVDQEFEGDLIEYVMTKAYKKPNHLVCLGAGEGAEQIVVHLYADADGNISETRTYTGVEEITEVYESPGDLTAANAGTVSDAVFTALETSGNVTTGTAAKTKVVTAEQAAEEREKKRADLVESATDHFQTLRELDEIEVDFDADEREYYIGDIVGAYEDTTGDSIAAAVSQKIIRLSGGTMTISYEVKDPTPPSDASEEG